MSLINSPKDGLGTIFISFQNQSGGALAHGDVIVKDLVHIASAVATTSTDTPEAATTSTTENTNKILGVVFDPSGFGVDDGAHGCAIIRGYHSAVKNDGNAITSYATLVHSTTAKTVQAVTAGADLAGCVVGHALETTTGTTTIKVFVDIK